MADHLGAACRSVRPVPDGADAAMLGAVGAAEYLTVALNAMTDDPCAAMRATRREHVDRALKTVKDVRLATVGRDREGLVVSISAVFTLFHNCVWLPSIACNIYLNYIGMPGVSRSL